MRSAKWMLLSLMVAACSGGQSESTVSSPSDGASSASTTSTPSTASTTSTASTSTAPSKGATTDDVAKSFVEAHNHYRASHCVAPLEWSADVAKTAQAWANELAHSGCKLRHSTTPLGENLAAGTTGTIPPEKAVELWYDESKGYDYSKTKFTMGAGHFTQLVWKGSRHVGCGTATCNDKQIWVCNYDPAGNIQGEFAANVPRPTCHP